MCAHNPNASIRQKGQKIKKAYPELVSTAIRPIHPTGQRIPTYRRTPRNLRTAMAFPQRTRYQRRGPHASPKTQSKQHFQSSVPVRKWTQHRPGTRGRHYQQLRPNRATFGRFTKAMPKPAGYRKSGRTRRFSTSSRRNFRSSYKSW